jgi:nucleoside-diphosphate-sugar epimerase
VGKQASTVLVTGASGRIGRHVVGTLLAAGYSLRALTSKPQLPAQRPGEAIEWRHHDWLQSVDFDAHVDGCQAVIHLGAEIWNIPKMQRLNVEATEQLARAAERAGVKVFAYTSSIAVYGSSTSPIVTEASPVLTVDRDIRSEYRANESLRAYGRTKLAGELKIRDACRRVEYVVLRPTIVVDIPDLLAVARWNYALRAISARRFTHQVYVKDVAGALLWTIERALHRTAVAPGVTVYNLSDEDGPESDYASFYRRLVEATGDQRYACRLGAPLSVYNLADMAKNRMFSRRLPLGMMRYSAAKLYAAGYAHAFGMGSAQALAAKQLMQEAR